MSHHHQDQLNGLRAGSWPLMRWDLPQLTALLQLGSLPAMTIPAKHRAHLSHLPFKVLDKGIFLTSFESFDKLWDTFYVGAWQCIEEWYSQCNQSMASAPCKHLNLNWSSLAWHLSMTSDATLELASTKDYYILILHVDKFSWYGSSCQSHLKEVTTVFIVDTLVLGINSFSVWRATHKMGDHKRNLNPASCNARVVWEWNVLQIAVMVAIWGSELDKYFKSTPTESAPFGLRHGQRGISNS